MKTEKNKAFIKGLIENILLVSEDTVKSGEITALLEEDIQNEALVQQCFQELIEEYRSRPVRIIPLAGGYTFSTTPEYIHYLKRFLQQTRKQKLSRPALEVLSIVGYKQPVTRVEIDHIRGVDSGHIVRGLLEKRFITTAGKKKDAPGKPMLYVTTKNFLKYFGLQSPDELKSFEVPE